MIIKKLKNQSPNASIWDKDKEKILFTFSNGEFETDDKYILNYWAKYFGDGVSIVDEGHNTEEVKPKKRGRPAKAK